MSEHFDLIVIGAGPAGGQAAAQAAGLGRRVALVEREPYLGGAGLTTGTMPSKMLREAAVALHTLRQRGQASVHYTLQPGTRLADLMYNRAVVVEAAWGLINRSVARSNIHIVRGAAAFQDAHTVAVTRETEDGPSETVLTGDVILIATGSTSIHPAVFPFEHPQVRDSESVLNLERLPGSLAIIGGGPIGCEYAAIFNALGVPVTVVESRARLLLPVDAELAQRWEKHLESLGAHFVLNETVSGVTLPAAAGGPVQLALRGGATLAAEVVLVAVGRRGNAAGLNLSAAGLSTREDGTLNVNDVYQTPVPHIYAAGDVVGWPALASTSREQARRAMAHAFEHSASGGKAVYPLAIYTIPEVAMVGLSEDECRALSLDYAVGRAFFENNPHAQITGDTSGMLKLLFAPADHRLLGAHLMCETASDLIHLAAQVLAAGGTLEAFTQAVYNYPTLSEAFAAAALDGLERWQRRHDPTAH
jgi:NAD(P) transhydrogenase